MLQAYRYASYLTDAEADQLDRFRQALVVQQESEDRLRDEERALEALERERIETVRSLHRLQDKKRIELDRIRSESVLAEQIVGDLTRTEQDLRRLLDRLGADGDRVIVAACGEKWSKVVQSLPNNDPHGRI